MRFVQPSEEWRSGERLAVSTLAIISWSADFMRCDTYLSRVLEKGPGQSLTMVALRDHMHPSEFGDLNPPPATGR